MIPGGRGAGFRSSLTRGSRGVDGPYDREAGRAREDPPDAHAAQWRTEAQRLAAAYLAEVAHVDQLGGQEVDSRGDDIDATGGGVRGSENFLAYRVSERDKPKPYVDRDVIAEESRGFEGLSRRAGGDDGRKTGFMRFDEAEYGYGDFKLGSSQVFGKAPYDDYGREPRFRDEAKELDVLTGVTRHERELATYSRDGYDPLRPSRRTRRREGMDYEGGRRYPEDERVEDLYSVRGDSVLGKRKVKPYEGGSAKDYYSDKRPVYLTTLEAEQLRRPKGDADLVLEEYDFKEFGGVKNDMLVEGQDMVGGLVEHVSRGVQDLASRRERSLKSEAYDRRSALSETVSDRDSDRHFSSRGRRGRRPPPRGHYSGDYHDGSDSRHGGSPRTHARGPSYVEERLGGKGDYRYTPALFVRDPSNGHRYKSHESAMDKGYEAALEHDRIQSPAGYELGNGGSWRGRSGDGGGRGHDMMEVSGRDKLAFLHHPDSTSFLPSSRHHSGPRSSFSKYRPDYYERDSWAPTFRGSRRGRRGSRHWGGVSQADELFRMHNMKARKYAGEDFAEPRYRSWSHKRPHRSPSRSGDHKASSKDSDWDADAADGAVEKPDGAVEKPDGDVTPLRDSSPGANGALEPSGVDDGSLGVVMDSSAVTGTSSFLSLSTSAHHEISPPVPEPNPVSSDFNPPVPDINSPVLEADDGVPETLPSVSQSNPSVSGESPAVPETEFTLSNVTAPEPLASETMSAVDKVDDIIPEIKPSLGLSATALERASAVDESFLAFSQPDCVILPSTCSKSTSTSPAPEVASTVPDLVPCALDSGSPISERTNSPAESVATFTELKPILPSFVVGTRVGIFHADQRDPESGAVVCITSRMEVVGSEGTVTSTGEEASRLQDMVMASEGKPADEHPNEGLLDVQTNSLDESREKTEAYQLQEDAAFQLYTKLFKESTDWRKMYEDQRHSGSFGCDVCLSSGIIIKYANLASLMEHTNSFSNSNELADHRGYARAVSHFLELSSSPPEAMEPCSAEPKQELNSTADAALTHQATEDTETVASRALEDTQVEEVTASVDGDHVKGVSHVLSPLKD